MLTWDEWRPIYERIAEELGLDPRRDHEAAETLNELIMDKPSGMDGAERKIRGGTVAIFGAGLSLRRDVEEFLDSGINACVVAADGASKAFLEHGVIPDIVVTDLDGGDEALVRCSREGSIMVVHGHGDNLDALRRVVPRLEGPVIGTTQVKPFGRLHNFGGFTDGDRAAYFSGGLGARMIVLGGMGLEERVGEYSKRIEDEVRLERKLRKLEIAWRLLSLFADRFKGQLYNASGSGREIPGFRRASFRELAKTLR